MDHSSQKALPRGPLIVLAISWLLLFGTLLIPRVALDGGFAVAVVRIADSGSRWVFPIVATLVVLLLVTRAGLAMERRGIEALVLGILFGLLFGVGDFLNEHFLKPVMGVPRPFAVELDEEGTLGTSIEAFYGGTTNAERSGYLKELLDNPYFTGVKLAEPVRSHWIQASGFSLPSGNTLGAYALLTFALVATQVLTGSVRYAVACLLVPWAIAIGYANVLLRLHWPNDVIVSAMAGILIGIGLYSLSRRLLWSNEPAAEEPAIAEEN